VELSRYGLAGLDEEPYPVLERTKMTKMENLMPSTLPPGPSSFLLLKHEVPLCNNPCELSQNGTLRYNHMRCVIYEQRTTSVWQWLRC
jgi:hypothetical protein